MSTSIVVTGHRQREAWVRKEMPPVEEVRPGLWSIPVLIPENPLRYILVYALATADGRLALIDTGWNTDTGWKMLVDGIHSTGHDLTDVSTFTDVRTEATDGALEFDVIDDNVYVLPGLAEDILDGPRRIDRNQLDLAVELFSDAADYADDDAVSEALASTTPLGWFVDYAINPDPKRLAPSAPFDNEAEAWRALEHDFEDRLEIKR